jgi:hypothetical protein
MKFYLTMILICLVFTIKGQNLDSIRNSVIDYAKYYLFVREIYPNRSAEIDSFNRNVKVTMGSPWCASYVSWVFDKNNIINPHSAWSPNFAQTKDQIWKSKGVNTVKLMPGDVVTFYYSNLQRVGHVGIIYKIDKDYILTVEGNTNGAGSREGDGVYLKKRELIKCYAVTRYIK